MVRIAKALGELLSHPPIVTISGALLAGYADRFIPLPRILPYSLRHASSLFLIAGIVLCLSAFKELWVRKTTVVPHGMPTALASTGIYRFSRNPIYLGYLSALLGIAVYLGSAQALIGAMYFFVVIHYTVIPMEERHLRQAMGDAYDTYCLTTRRWI
jgi:protein-S-isoprenylcysteine O-methyltransferase Ste14